MIAHTSMRSRRSPAAIVMVDCDMFFLFKSRFGNGQNVPE